MKRYLPTNKTCAAVLGVMIAALSGGCANEAPIGKAPEAATKQHTTAITSRGVEVQNCSATAIFDITSQEAIEFIALDRSDISNLRSELFSVDEMGRETRISQEMVEVDSSLQSLLEQMSNNVNASELSRRAARELISRTSSSTSTESVDHSDSARSHSDSSSAQASQSSASRDVIQEASAERSELVADERASLLDLDSFVWGGIDNSTSRRETAASARRLVAADSEFLLIAEHADQSQASRSAQNQSTDTASANRTSRTTTTAVFDALNRQTEMLDESALASASAANRVVRADQQSLNQQHLAMTNLDFLNSRHLVLRVQFDADEEHEMVRVFQGAFAERELESVQRSVTAQGDAIAIFPVSCIGVVR